MKQVSCNDKLQKEKEKLGRLVDEALEKDTPIAQDMKVMEQNRKVDALVTKLQREKERHRKNSRNDKTYNQ